MFDFLKRFVSRYTDIPIYKGTGVTTLDPLTTYYNNVKPKTAKPPVFMIRDTTETFHFVTVRTGRESGICYIVLQHTATKEELIISNRLFKEIFTRFK